MSSNEVFLLNKVIDELNDFKLTLVSPLMKLKYLGSLIKNKDLIDYTTAEIDGYNDEASIPEYRKSIVDIEVTLQAYQNHHKVKLPASILEPPFDEKLRYVNIREGIGTVEQFVADRSKDDKPEQFFYRPIPMEMLHILQPAAVKLYKSDVRLTVIDAVVKGNAYKLNEILNTVRSKLLTLTIEIAERFGYELKVSSFNENQETNNQTINYYMNTEIKNTGDGNIVNTGNNVSLVATISISQDDQKHLNTLGVEDAKIEELNNILASEGNNKPKLKSLLLKWLGEVSAHVAAIGLGHNLPAISEFVGKLF